MASERVLICGASTRAVADSAARAGFTITALDAFGDLDQHAAVRALSMRREAGRRFTATAAARAARDVACDAVAYLSPFENHPRAVAVLARGRALWGNPPEVLARVRNPRLVARVLQARGLPSLAVRMHDPDGSNDSNDPDDPHDWMLKPLRSGGGHRIRPWPRGAPVPRGTYRQERATGTPGSIVFVAAGGRVVPLAMSRQLIGERDFGAAGYRYCGNIIAAAGDPQWERPEALAEAACGLARAAAEEFGLVGVNGIDFIARDGIPYPVEINPRWPGSMEVAERASGQTLFGVHAAACSTGVLPDPDLFRARPGIAAGKAILFARADVIMGDTDAWMGNEDVRDVPHPGERIRAGHPVCTVLAMGRDAAACRDALFRRAGALYIQLGEWASARRFTVRRLFCAFIVVLGSAASFTGAGAQAPASGGRGQGAAAAAQPTQTALQYQQKGEQYRVYNFPVTGESIPYRLFVPTRWTPAARLPVLVTLRAGQTVDGPYRAGNDLVKQAEQRGFIVVTPMGYRPLRQPYYGSTYRIARPNGPEPADGWTAEENARAEQDVLHVVDLVTKEYNADTSRLYLHGQNPSASGALHLAATYPDRFAAVVVSSGPIVYDAYPFDRLRDKVALLVIHGDQDAVNPIDASQKMAAAARAAGVDATYATVPGGTHLEAYLTYASSLFDFLEMHGR